MPNKHAFVLHRGAAITLAIGLVGLLPAAAKDRRAQPALISLMADELHREYDSLRTKASLPPYYMAFEAFDSEVTTLTASLGALISDTTTHRRGLDTTVRVGSPAFDNYHPFSGSRAHFTLLRPLSLDDNPDQIRRTLWSETDRVYRATSLHLQTLKTDTQLLADGGNKDADFSAEAPQHAINPPPALSFDKAAMETEVRDLSGQFRTHPQILESSVGFTALRDVRSFVDTEGGEIERGTVLYRFEAAAFGLAPDGMDIALLSTAEASEPSHFASAAHLQERLTKLASNVDALIAAPPAEPIVCPAILSGRAAAVFFHEIFGHRMEGHRQKDINEGQTFTKMLGQPVLPSFLSVLSDPTTHNFDGSDLIGSYDFDDEGVRAQPVVLVENGVLKTFLLSRSPVSPFAHSNGHGRRQAGFEVVSRQSNLFVRSQHQVSESQLKGQLIEEVKRQGKPYGLYFEEVSSGFTTTGRAGLQAFTVVPLIVYRVYPDGRPDELIRGVDIVGTPLASFSKILATSDHSSVFNGFCGAESGSIPVSAVSPSILVSEIETQKKRNGQQRLPILPRPDSASSAL